MPRLILKLLLLGVTCSLNAAGATYRCPMHPWITSEQPGKCTVCGMALVAAMAPNAAAPAGIIALSPSTITTIGIETALVTLQPLERTLRVNGRIEDDDTRHRIVAARVPGRVEKLHINYIGAEVDAQAPLITLYSPEVLSAQRIFVERLRIGSAGPATELALARERLLELGLTAEDVAALTQSQQPSATITVRAPFTGTVVAKSVYEGQYVSVSDRLLELADFSKMWFVFDAYEQDLPWLRVGQSLEITTRAVPGEVIHAPIDFIDPNFDAMTRTTKVRAVLPNPHYSTGGEPHRLPHRVVAEGRVLVPSPAVLAAPRSAILDRGTGPIAYVERSSGQYEPRTVKLGRSGDTLVEILSGLAAGDHVVTHGALLVDAQAQLAHEATSHATPSSPATVTVPPAVLRALADAVVDATAALANDDFASYQKRFPSVVAAAQLFPALPSLELGSDLKTARRSFEPWSTAVADLLRPQRATLGLKIFQCSMSPVLGKGRWIQRAAPLKNPFFGDEMSDCGEEVP